MTMTMNKRLAILIVALGVISGALFAGFSVWHSASTTPTFETGGYVLCGVGDEAKWASFQQGEKYVSTLSGTVNFTSAENGKTSVPKESFVHFDDGSMMALSDGVLLDFNDLSDNFINNYYLNAGVRIAGNGGTYTAETSSGTMEFGEYLWKLSDQKFMVVSPSLKVHLSDSDVREVSDYVQIVITEDKVVYLLTSENLWMTISDGCYVETAGGVRIYPVSQLIENDSYKLSMAKLSVSMDDAIVLTQDETRRQIVPELNINAVDGEDGQDGEDGRTGQNGQAGEAGVDGEDGQKGEDGQTGADGKQGADGAAGARGSNGSGGANGGNGAKGNDAVTETTTNSALPTMTITDWNISATRLSGTIKVTDNGELLEAIGEITGGKQDYSGSVTITNVKTGKAIACYQLADKNSAIGESTAFNFYNGADEVYFATKDGDMEPDTEYKLSVVAYYKTKDQTGLIYSREFISRTFYTDSTGVTLAYETATESSVTVTATISDSYLPSFSVARVFLLTPEQNDKFTAASIHDEKLYTATCTIGSGGEATFNNGMAEINFTKDTDGQTLPANTKYIVRVYVETTGGLKTLTNQALEVSTLKRTPTLVQEDGQPAAYYNRTTGAFEVYRPAMKDPDGGAESYTYTAYYMDSDGKWVEDSKRTITPSTGEPVEFHLDSGKVYRFGVTMRFNDNEKLVDMDLGYSNEVKADGDTMPKVTLIPDENGVDYNKYKGKLRISLAGDKSSIKVGNDYPMELELYADQILDMTVTLKGSTDSATLDNRYTITLMESKNKNQLDIALDLMNLYKNSNYSITVTGYLDLGDGNGPVKRVIGTASFRTQDTVTLKANWSTPDEISTSFARVLKLAVQDDQANTSRGSYALDELRKGQVTVELFSGTGTGKLRIAQKNFTTQDELSELFSSAGLEITETSFGGPSLSKDGSYTLTITEVTDRTCELGFGYVNDFENVLNSSEVVAAEPTPPDLLTDPSKGVTATPIHNIDAVEYGGKVDEDLPDDAVVGYALASTYDNVQRIGKSITYYAFEYNTFFNALSAGDPLKNAAPLMKVTLPIDDSKDTVPKIVLLFGGTKTESNPASAGGYQVYYTGVADQPGSALLSGMGRGYRYIFAYTVEYAGSTSGESQTTKTYPYDHKEYSTYNSRYGGVTENGVQVGRGTTYYILNSGMCEVPVIMPDFHTYVYDSSASQLATASASIAEGTVTLHYTWRDPDGVVITGLSEEKNTKLSYPGTNDTHSQNVDYEHVSGSANWYTATMPYAIMNKDGTDLLEPTVNISEYRVDYTNVLKSFNLKEDTSDYKIAEIPLDWSWESQFERWNTQLPLIQIDTEYLKENYILFNLVSETGSGDVLTNAINRAVGVRLTIREEGGATREFLLPLTYDGGQPAAKLASGQLGSNCLNKKFTLEKAELFYDTGRQGWNLAATQPEFALQLTNSDSAKDEFAFGSYIGASDNSDIPGNNALLTKYGNTLDLGNLRDLVKANEKDDNAKLAFSFESKIRSGFRDSRFLFPNRMGVDADISNIPGQYKGVYMVPKEIKTLSLKTSGGSDWTMTKVTPIMTDPVFHVSLYEINIEGFTVTGLTDTSAGIKVAAYENIDDANYLRTPAVGPIDIHVDSSGRVAGFDISSLQPQKTYFLAFYYIAPDGTSTLLLKTDTSHAVYSVTTSGGVNVDITDMQYVNDNYFDKRLDVKFTLNRTMNVEMRYDIYDSEVAATASSSPLLSYEDMVTGDANELLTVPKQADLTSTGNNSLKLDLTPSTKRNKLKPGVTYWLKITAQEKGEDGNYTVSGSKIQDFTITPIGDYGALIYVKNASDRSITYQVTITDPQFTLMSRPTKKPTEAAGLYAVRFTDANGNRLHTSYDKEVYSASDLQKVFVLDDDTLLNDTMNIVTNRIVQENTPYQLHIYAVPDDDHNGEIDIAGVKKTWSDFFDSASAALSDCGQKLLDLLNTFWTTDTKPDSKQNETRNKLMIASKNQSTTTTDGWLLNEPGVYATRADANTVRVVFQESIGLIDDTSKEPVFKRIDWSVQGLKYNGSDSSTPLFASGSQYYSKQDQLLVEARIGGYDTYYFEMPYDLTQGSYTIVLQLYEKEDDTVASRTVTIRTGA